ncbi:PD-(D/E)XK nuclease family protein [Oerskovia sp. M15]
MSRRTDAHRGRGRRRRPPVDRRRARRPSGPGRAARDGRELTEVGLARLAALSKVLRDLRGQTYLSLPELVTQAERALGLDIEVTTAATLAAGGFGEEVGDRGVRTSTRSGTSRRPSRSPRTCRRSVRSWPGWVRPAPRSAASTCPCASPTPTRCRSSRCTRRRAWSGTSSPCRAWSTGSSQHGRGDKGPTDSGWFTGLGNLPYPLRGDAEDLPVFHYEAAEDAKDLDARRKEFLAANGEHQVDEERRLAYVAFTRARAELLLAGSWWRDATKPRTPSPFLVELAEAGILSDADWAGAPEKDASNPRDELVHEADWPRGEPGADGSGAATEAGDSTATLGRTAERRARAVVRAAADRVRSASTPAPRSMLPRASAQVWAWWRTGGRPARRLGHGPARARADPARGARPPGRPQQRDHVPGAHLGVRARAPCRGPGRVCAAPAAPGACAAHGARAPRHAVPPVGRAVLHVVVAARRRRPARADDEDISPDLDLDALQQTFLASEWAGRTRSPWRSTSRPRGRDHVPLAHRRRLPESPEHAGGARDAVVVVDWKTGKAPRDAEARRTREVQLAVYRLAWSRWSGLPVEKVNAAFYYLGSDETVRPERLLDAGELEALVAGAGV